MTLPDCHRDDCPGGQHLHWSALRYMMTSPLHYRYNVETETVRTPSMVLGLAIHAAILEPLKLGRDYVVYPKTRRGKAWDEFSAQHPESIILTESEYRRVEGAVEAVTSRRIPWLTESGETEMRMEWTEPRHGFSCVGRVDRLVRGIVVEIKTTSAWGERQFAAQAARMGYHVQHAWYIDGLREMGYKVLDEAITVAVENRAPFDTAVYYVPPEAIEAGREIKNGLVDRLKECSDTNTWPGVAPEQTRLTLPAWSLLDEPESIDIDGEEYRV